MDKLPDEVILQIVSFLTVPETVSLQSISKRYLRLARDNQLWKLVCFELSRAETQRRRNHLLNLQDPGLAELRNAVSALPGADLTALDVAQLRGGNAQIRASSDPEAEARLLRNRSSANWEPGYPDERIDYYEEHIRRHAPISVGWLDLPKCQGSDREESREATGVGLLKDGHSMRVVSPLDDGSISIYDVSNRSTSSSGGGGKPLAHSKPGLLTGRDVSESHIVMTETGAVECVSINSEAQKGYFAVENLLQEIDLNTFQLTSTKRYPFPITALSECSSGVPLTVGTNMTIHLHDPRDSAFTSPASDSSAGELIAGPASSHAVLSQPGPLSILHYDGHLAADPSSIWLAGRFTSLLNYDRRFFPRLRGTVHSGARIASLCSLPYPLIPRSMDLVRNPNVPLSAFNSARSGMGTTIMAAAEYKGKGSLELYGLPTGTVQPYQNRQTASASKLLSVAAHGGQIVFSDGDGNLKWAERDGFSVVRKYNINEALQLDDTSSGGAQDAGQWGIWSSGADEMGGQNGDIVQKIIPLDSATSNSPGDDRPDLDHSPLLLWTGDGKLGFLGFGHSNPLSLQTAEDWHDALEDQSGTVEEKARKDAEKQFGQAMRRALKRNADEVRFVRGLGMGYMRP